MTQQPSERSFDELARALDENSISRAQALRWAGYAVAGAALSSMGFADRAEALSRKARRRCRRKGGTPLNKGECHCASTCGPAFTCQNDPNCLCLKTLEGKGFCAHFSPCGTTCSTNSQCPTGWKCVDSCCGPNCVPPCGP